MNNKVKNTILIILAIGIVGMTIAYAALSQTLNITSTAKVKASTWDVHFANGGTVGTTGSATVATQPTLANTTISGLVVELTKPNDKIQYTFDVYNAGTIDAILSTYTLNSKGNGITCTDSEGSTTSSNATTVCNNLTFTLTYTNNTTAAQTGTVITAGSPVAKNQQLKARQKVNLTLTVSYSGNSVPSSDITIGGLDASLIYTQN
ncbi:MAG: hypothetical protein J6J17_02215 [Bacilli bacterium]|nr:hypothetical protein [Bacilli bacterium]